MLSTVRVMTTSSLLNSRTILDSLSPFERWISLLSPSWVMVDLTFLPSAVSSSNSSPSLNLMTVFLKVELELREYSPLDSVISMTGDTALPIFLVTRLTPRASMNSSNFSLLSSLYLMPQKSLRPILR